MAKPGRGARIKGASFERELGKLLSERTGYTWKRGLGQTRRGGQEVSDVMCDELPKFHIEAKRQIRCNIKAAIAQADNDVKESNKTPIVITKDDRGDILVTMHFEDWVNMFNSHIKSDVTI